MRDNKLNNSICITRNNGCSTDNKQKEITSMTYMLVALFLGNRREVNEANVYWGPQSDGSKNMHRKPPKNFVVFASKFLFPGMENLCDCAKKIVVFIPALELPVMLVQYI